MTTLKLGLIKLGGYYPKGPNLTGAGVKAWVMIMAQILETQWAGKVPKSLQVEGVSDPDWLQVIYDPQILQSGPINIKTGKRNYVL